MTNVPGYCAACAKYSNVANIMGYLLQVDTSKGTVGFGSGLHGWAFTLKQFAELYASKFKIEPVKLMSRLWGDNFFSAKDRKWNKVGGEGYVRGFNQFVLDPIYKVCKTLHELIELFEIWWLLISIS